MSLEGLIIIGTKYNLIGSWMNSILLAVEVLVSWIYISKYWDHIRRPTKWTIFAMLCNDSAHSVVLCTTVYLNLILDLPTDPKTWPNLVNITSTFLSSSIEQTFLAYRLYTISKSMLYLSLISLIWTTRAIFTWGGFVGTAIHSYIGILSPTILIRVAVGISALVDLCLTGGIVYTSSQWETLFKPTRSLLRRVVRNAVISGSVASLSALLLVISSIYYKPVFVVLYMCIGRIYSLTIIISLWILKIQVHMEESSVESLTYEGGTALRFRTFRSTPATSTAFPLRYSMTSGSANEVNYGDVRGEVHGKLASMPEGRGPREELEYDGPGRRTGRERVIRSY